jgi:RimJ/RimL family protein N-acetyltransferase
MEDSGALPGDVILREATKADPAIFYEQQLDPEATRMAAFPPKDFHSFMSQWSRIMAGETVVLRTILFDGRVASNLVSFVQDGRRVDGYWLGRAFWGKGIATLALAKFLSEVEER